MSYITKQCTVIRCNKCSHVDWAYGNVSESREYFEESGWRYTLSSGHVCKACQDREAKS